MKSLEIGLDSELTSSGNSASSRLSEEALVFLYTQPRPSVAEENGNGRNIRKTSTMPDSAFGGRLDPNGPEGKTAGKEAEKVTDMSKEPRGLQPNHKNPFANEDSGKEPTKVEDWSKEPKESMNNQVHPLLRSKEPSETPKDEPKEPKQPSNILDTKMLEQKSEGTKASPAPDAGRSDSLKDILPELEVLDPDSNSPLA